MAARKTTKKAAPKKVAAKKSPVKKATAKKSPVKKAVKKSPAKKAAAHGLKKQAPKAASAAVKGRRRCAASRRSGTCFAPTPPRCSSSARRRSTCSAWTDGCATSTTSPTTTRGTASIHRCSRPQDKPYIEFESGEEINNYLLRHDEVRAFMQRSGGRPKVAMVFFDEETEAICKELGYDLILPPATLREHLDSKIVTTRLGNEAGAPSVPNVLGEIESWQELLAAAAGAGLGSTLSCRPLTATRARPRSSSSRRRTGTSTPTTSSANRRR